MGWIADLLKEIPSAARYKSELDGMARENADLKAENAALQAKTDVLESTVSDLRQEIQRRDDVVQNEQTHVTLPREQDQILRFLETKNGSDERLISSQTGLSLSDAIHFLNELRANDYVIGDQQRPPANDPNRRHAMPSNWSLQPKAFKYLHEHKTP